MHSQLWPLNPEKYWPLETLKFVGKQKLEERFFWDENPSRSPHSVTSSVPVCRQIAVGVAEL